MKSTTQYVAAVQNNIEFCIGQHAQDNFDLLDASNPHDMWFHIGQASSCHVIARIPADTNYTKKQLHKIAVQGAVLCKQHSKYKGDPQVSVIYTKIQHVNKTSTVGTVTLDTYKTITI